MVLSRLFDAPPPGMPDHTTAVEEVCGRDNKIDEIGEIGKGSKVQGMQGIAGSCWGVVLS